MNNAYPTTMKKNSFIISISLMLIILYSCGGVTGNIKKYRFETASLDSVKAAVARVYLNHPEYRNFDTAKFQEGRHLGDASYYCRIKTNNQDYFFKYAYPQYPQPNDTIVEIALLSAAKFGGDLELAKNIGYFKKRTYKKIFEEHFIANVYKELSQ